MNCLYSSSTLIACTRFRIIRWRTKSVRNAFNLRTHVLEKKTREAVTLTRTRTICVLFHFFYRTVGQSDTLQFKIVSSKEKWNCLLLFFFAVFVFNSLFLGATFCSSLEKLLYALHTLDLYIYFFSIQKHYKIVISINKLWSLFTDFGLCEKRKKKFCDLVTEQFNVKQIVLIVDSCISVKSNRVDHLLCLVFGVRTVVLLLDEMCGWRIRIRWSELIGCDILAIFVYFCLRLFEIFVSELWKINCMCARSLAIHGLEH